MCPEFSASVPEVPAEIVCSRLSRPPPPPFGPGWKILLSTSSQPLSAELPPICCQFVVRDVTNTTAATDMGLAQQSGIYEF